MKPRILVVDDEKIQRETLAAILTDQGYTVATAACVTEAKSVISKDVYGLIISDFKIM